MNIRPELHAIKINDSEWEFPKAIFNLSNDEKTIFYNVFHDLKVPDEYASNISSKIKLKKRKFADLKNHDCYMIM